MNEDATKESLPKQRRTEQRVLMAAERRKASAARAVLAQSRAATACKVALNTDARASVALQQTKTIQRMGAHVNRLLDSIERVSDEELDGEPLTKRVVQAAILADKVRDFLCKPAPSVAIQINLATATRELARLSERLRKP
jgi:hypothetical protein